MHEPALGGEREGVRHLLPHAHHMNDVHRAGILFHLLVEGAAGNQLHGDVRHALFLSEGVYLRYVGMVETRSRLRLALETLDEFGVRAKALEHHLDADLAVKHLVARKIYAAHTAVPQLLFEQELPEIGGRLYHRFFVVGHRFWFLKSLLVLKDLLYNTIKMPFVQRSCHNMA